MDANSRKKPSQLEINDLIAEAVVNAEARRNQAEELLSDEEAAAVKGGYTSFGVTSEFGVIPDFPIVITCGMIEVSPSDGWVSESISQKNITLNYTNLM
jgi:hypothetical protein